MSYGNTLRLRGTRAHVDVLSARLNRGTPHNGEKTHTLIGFSRPPRHLACPVSPATLLPFRVPGPMSYVGCRGHCVHSMVHSLSRLR